MKKIVLIIITVFLNSFLLSCSTDDIIEFNEQSKPELIEDIEPQACCGDEGDIPPPPPPSGD